MTLTPWQQKIRSAHVTASEVPSLLGLDPYRTPNDLWLEKTGQVQKSDQAGEAAEIGHMVEPGLIRWASRELGCKVSRNNALRVHRDGILSCTHDALIIGKPQGIQAKTSGISNRYSEPSLWGQEGTDQVPERVIVQCQAEMAVSELERVWVPALIGGRGRVMYVIERSEPIITIILQKSAEFWACVLEKRIPHEAGIISPEYLYRRMRVPGKTVFSDKTELLEKYCQCNEAYIQAREKYEEAKGRILAEMGDAEEIIFPDESCFTHYAYTARHLDIKSLRQDHPDMARDYMIESRRRKFLFKKNRNKGPQNEQS